MSKDTKIISDLRSFFAKNDDNRAIKCIMGVMEHINIRSSQIGVEKKENCKFTTLQVLNLLMLFPFFVVKNASRYSNSSLRKLFNLCHLMGEPQETRPSCGAGCYLSAMVYPLRCWYKQLHLYLGYGRREPRLHRYAED